MYDNNCLDDMVYLAYAESEGIDPDREWDQLNLWEQRGYHEFERQYRENELEVRRMVRLVTEGFTL